MTPLTPTLTAREGLQIALQRYESGETHNLRSGEVATFDPRRAAVLATHWNDTFELIAQRHDLGVCGDDVPILPYVKYLDRYAARASYASSDSVPLAQNAMSAVRFICAALGIKVPGRNAAHVPWVRESLPVGWRDGFDALRVYSHEDNAYHTRRNYPSAYAALASLAALHGIQRPQDVPSDTRVWRKWAREDGVGAQQLEDGLTAIKRAGELLGVPHDWPRIGAARLDQRGIRQIPDLAAKLAAAGYTGKPEALDDVEVIRLLYPRIGFGLDRYLAFLKGRVRDGREWKALETISRLCFALDALGFPRDGDVVDVYTTLVDAPEATVATDSLLNKRAPAPGERRQISFARLLLRTWGAASCKRSTLRPVEESEEPLPFFTETVQHDFRRLHQFARAAHEDDMLQHSDPAVHILWARAVAESDSIKSYIKSYNKPRLLAGRMDPEKLLALISLPQAILMGGNALRLKALAARDRWLAAGGGHTSRHFTSYVAALWDWAVVTICLADGLRGKNYVGALANKHVVPTWRGKLIVGLATHFWGIHDEGCVRLKKTWSDTTRSKENERENDIYPALLEPVLTTDFWTLARPYRLVKCGALESIESYDRTADYFAVFPSVGSKDRPSSKYTPRPGFLTGRYASTSPFSMEVGRIVHWMIRDVMGRKDIPEYDDPRIRTVYRGLFGAHRMVRFLNGSFWGFEADDWRHAEWITNDTLPTIKRHYAREKGGAAAERMRRRTGIDAVGHFVPLMQHIRAGGAVDWDRFDPERPSDAIMHDSVIARRRRTASKAK
jgi:hypothetical protein